MRNSYLLGLGGALLASTSLSTAASAATILAYANTYVVGSNAPTATTNPFVSAKIGAQLYGATGLTATSALGGALGQYAFIQFTNQYGVALQPTIILNITGASFSATSLGSQSASNLTLFSYSTATASTFTATASGAAATCSVGVLSTQIQLSACNIQGTNGAGTNSSFLIGALGLSGLIYTASTGLSAAGATVALSGSIVQASNQSNTFETITSTNVITSVNNAVISVGTSAVTANQGTGAVPFVTVSGGLLPNGEVSSGLTAVLASIYITGSGAVGADLATVLVANQIVGNLALTVTSAALADPAIANVRFIGQAQTSAATSTTLTGTASFPSLSTATLYAGAGAGTNTVQIEYNGTASITGGTAGTLAGTFLAGAGQGAANAALSGATSSITRAGINTQINSVQASTNTFVTSYIRITNGGAVAGTVLLTVYNAASGGTALGTMTTASIPGFSTLQLSAAQIEAGAGITPVVGGSYTVQINGALPNGYVQHVTGNPGGVFTDFSGRRDNQNLD